jgi:hypothetical protein
VWNLLGSVTEEKVGEAFTRLAAGLGPVRQKKVSKTSAGGERTVGPQKTGNPVLDALFVLRRATPKAPALKSSEDERLGRINAERILDFLKRQPGLYSPLEIARVLAEIPEEAMPTPILRRTAVLLKKLEKEGRIRAGQKEISYSISKKSDRPIYVKKTALAYSIASADSSGSRLAAAASGITRPSEPLSDDFSQAELKRAILAKIDSSPDRYAHLKQLDWDLLLPVLTNYVKQSPHFVRQVSNREYADIASTLLLVIRSNLARAKKIEQQQLQNKGTVLFTDTQLVLNSIVFPPSGSRLAAAKLESVVSSDFTIDMGGGFLADCYVDDHPTEHFTTITADVYREGQVTRHFPNTRGEIFISVYHPLKLIEIHSFYPRFPSKEHPDYKEGRGRDLLKHILLHSDRYAGYAIASAASNQFQDSFMKMGEEFQPLTFRSDRRRFQQTMDKWREMVRRDASYPYFVVNELMDSTLYGVVPSGARLAQNDAGMDRRGFLRRSAVVASAFAPVQIDGSALLSLIQGAPAGQAREAITTRILGELPAMLRYLVFGAQQTEMNRIFLNGGSILTSQAQEQFELGVFIDMETADRARLLPMGEVTRVARTVIEKKMTEMSPAWTAFRANFASAPAGMTAAQAEMFIRTRFAENAVVNELAQSATGKNLLTAATHEATDLARVVRSLTPAEVTSVRRAYDKATAAKQRFDQIGAKKEIIRARAAHRDALRRDILRLKEQRKSLEVHFDGISGDAVDFDRVDAAIERAEEEIKGLTRSMDALSRSARRRIVPPAVELKAIQEWQQAEFRERLRLFVLKLWSAQPQGAGKEISLLVDKRFAQVFSIKYNKTDDALQFFVQGSAQPLIEIPNARTALQQSHKEIAAAPGLTQNDLLVMSRVAAQEAAPCIAGLRAGYVKRIEVPLSYFSGLNDREWASQVSYAVSRAAAIRGKHPQIVFFFSGEKAFSTPRAVALISIKENAARYGIQFTEPAATEMALRVRRPEEAITANPNRAYLTVSPLENGAWPNWDGLYAAAADVADIYAEHFDYDHGIRFNEVDRLPENLRAYLERHAAGKSEGRFEALLLRSFRGDAALTPEELKKLAFWLPLAEKLNWQAIFQGARLAEKTLAASA